MTILFLSLQFREVAAIPKNLWIEEGRNPRCLDMGAIWGGGLIFLNMDSAWSNVQCHHDHDQWWIPSSGSWSPSLKMSWPKSGSLPSWEEIEIFQFNLMCWLGCMTLYPFCVFCSFPKQDGTDMRRYHRCYHRAQAQRHHHYCYHHRQQRNAHRASKGHRSSCQSRVTNRHKAALALFLIWRKDPAAFTELSGVSKEAWWTKIDKAFVGVDLIGIRISGDQCFSGFHWHLHWHLARPHH